MQIITCPYLVAIMTRGAAALTANCQSSFDTVSLYHTSNLVIKEVGFIIVQVMNHVNYVKPNSALFKNMDPFLCELLSGDDSPDFTVPIIWTVFALGGMDPPLQHMIYESPGLARQLSTRTDHAVHVRSDFWCSGIGPDPLQLTWTTPKLNGSVVEQNKWDVGLLSTAQDVRRSQYPGGGGSTDHYDA
ncbi:hypothetical protein BJY52DRAFT_907687 [Lactarius psammicola]|nr:hypothetical protein BJY52DRAFT_907687 [Lactarius psammicola]